MTTNNHDFAKDRSVGPMDLTVLGMYTEPGHEGEPAGYWQHDRALHTQIIGATGGGKSTLVESIVTQDIAAGRGGMLIDPHGDTAARVLAAVGQRQGVRYLTLPGGQRSFPEDRFGLRLLSICGSVDGYGVQDAADQAHQVLGGILGIKEPRLSSVLYKALLALAWVPAALRGNEFRSLESIVSDPGRRMEMLAYAEDPSLKEWWAETAAANAASLSSLANLLAELGENSVLGSIMEAEALDLTAAMDGGEYLVVSLAAPSVPDKVRYAVGSLLVQEVIRASLGRQRRIPEASRRRFHLVLDDGHRYTGDSFSPFMEEARKYGVSVTLVHQAMGQLDGTPMLRKTIEGNIMNRIVYAVGVEDANYLEPFMAPLTAQDIAGLPAFHVAAKLRVDGDRKAPARVLRTYAPGQEIDRSGVGSEG